MRIGRFDLHLLSDGRIKLDGGAMFGLVPKVLWQEHIKADGRNRVRLGLNCLLICSTGGNILVDTGAGKKLDDHDRDIFGLGNSHLVAGLRELGLAPRDINYVVLTHLHFDHSGGCTKRNKKGQVVPTFPEATYLVQRAAWEAAMNPNERGRASYHRDDFQVLVEREQMQFLDGDKELMSGIWLKVTNGHTHGHQAVLLNQAGSKVAFLGDIVPTHYHLNLPYITAFDQFPEETLERKRVMLTAAEREGWLLLFYHGGEHRAGYLERRDGRLCLRPEEL
jgi:glyoxylase-like metal-dependent hydrolase (beta-lactamase superfamily II)